MSRRQCGFGVELILYVMVFTIGPVSRAQVRTCPQQDPLSMSGSKMADVICKGIKEKKVEAPAQGWFNMCGVGGREGFGATWNDLKAFGKFVAGAEKALVWDSPLEAVKLGFKIGQKGYELATNKDAAKQIEQMAHQDAKASIHAVTHALDGWKMAQEATQAFIADLGHKASLVGSSIWCLPWEWKARYICMFIEQVATSFISGDGLMTGATKAATFAKSIARFENETKLIEDMRGLTAGDRIGAATGSREPLVERRGLLDRLAPGASRTKARADLISKYVERKFTTPEQNKKWAEAATMLKPDGKTKFFDVENSVMKKLNDTLRDKNLVTAVTNLHKEEVIQQLRLLQARNPGLKVLAYSDFKSVRYAFTGQVPHDLEAQLNVAYQAANKSFSQKVRNLGILRESDNPESWFKAGYGETADRANLSARAAREAKGEPQMLSYADSSVRDRMTAQLKGVEASREALQTNPRVRSLLEGEAEGAKKIPSRETFDLIRKNGDPEILAKAIKARYGLTQFNASDAEALISYAKKVDDFSPGIHVINREIVNLDGATHGGFSVDFLGLGSANQNATAKALAKSSGLDDALVHAREGERDVTVTFSSRLKEFRSAVGGIAKCSGDDCVGVAVKVLSRDDKQSLLNRLSQNPQTREVRVGFVADGVRVPADRTMLSTHAESIEKYLRKHLEGRLPNERLQSITFGIDMDSKALGRGRVRWLAGVNGAELSSVEKTAINEALTKAVSDLNASMKAQGAGTNYVPELIH